MNQSIYFTNFFNVIQIAEMKMLQKEKKMCALKAPVRTTSKIDLEKIIGKI